LAGSLTLPREMPRPRGRAPLRVLAVTTCLAFGVYAYVLWFSSLTPTGGAAERIFFLFSLALMAGATLVAMSRPFRAVPAFFVVLPVLNAARKWVSIELGPAMAPSSVLLWTLALVFFVRTRPVERVSVPGLRRTLGALVVSGLLSIVASVFIGVPDSRAVLAFVTGIVEPILILVMTLATCVRPGGALSVIRGMVASGVGSVVLWSFLYRVGGATAGHGGYLDDPGVMRSVLGSLTYGNVLHFAHVALVLVPLAFLPFVYGRRRGLIGFGAVALIILGLVIGSSRGALLALVFVLVLLFRRRVAPRALLVALVTVTALAGAWMFRGVLAMRAEDTGGMMSGDLSEADISRVEGWSVALHSMLHHPLGVGGGNFDFSWARWSRDTSLFGEHIGGPHNLWLSVGAEFGVPTALVLAVLVAFFLGLTQRSWRRTPWVADKLLAAALQAAIAGYFAMGTFSDGELTHLSARARPMNAHTLFVFAAMGVAAAQAHLLGQGRSTTRGARQSGGRPASSASAASSSLSTAPNLSGS
jgi:O-antigen ligase